MRLESVTLSGFRCFGPHPVSVALSKDIVAVVGPNAAGKTALLQALAKLFGVTRAQRTVLRSDFHVGAEEDPNERQSKRLIIDALIAFPELVDGSATPETIAPSFRHMLIERTGKAPACRFAWRPPGRMMEQSKEKWRSNSSGSIPSTRNPRIATATPSSRPTGV